jgi:hypothetical protein
MMKLYIFINVFKYCNLKKNQLILMCCTPNINPLLFVMAQTSSFLLSLKIKTGLPF